MRRLEFPLEAAPQDIHRISVNVQDDCLGKQQMNEPDVEIVPQHLVNHVKMPASVGLGLVLAALASVGHVPRCCKHVLNYG